MLKVLWLTNYQFTSEPPRGTGNWVSSLGRFLSETGRIKIINVTHGRVTVPARSDSKNIEQWILPWELYRGKLSRESLAFLRGLESDFQPHLVHVWGTEYLWADLAADDFFRAPALIDIQGLMAACAEFFYGGLSFRDALACTGLKEILYPKRLLFFRQREFYRRGAAERRILSMFKYVSVQSEWTRNWICQEEARVDREIFCTAPAIRNEFYASKPWAKRSTDEVTIFTSLSGANTFKGLHTLVRAFSLVKNQVPEVRLRVAGQFHGARFQDGYALWLMRLIRNLGLENSVEWLGPIEAERMALELANADVAVVPSFVETYCLALAESMVVGTPSVVAYAGAMPELATHGRSALFFAPGDHVSCATQISKLLIDAELSQRISLGAREASLTRNMVSEVGTGQLKIYDHILARPQFHLQGRARED